MKMKQKDFNWRSPLSIMHYALALPTFLTLGHLRASSHAARLIGMLCIVLLCGLSMSVTSCKDDDDEKKGNEQNNEEQNEEAQNAYNVFWSVVGQLTSTVNVSADYEGKTFAPTIGEPLDGNSTIRAVATGDMEAAAERFANLVGLTMGDGFNVDTQEYTWKHDAVGTLTYHKSTDGLSLATVDVNIKQMPGLQKIVYRTQEQTGANGTFDGTAYYRFGDVVKRTYNDPDDNNKQKVEYWVCVRPAVGPAGKKTSHWVTVSPPPRKNIWPYVGDPIPFKDSHDRQWSLPTGIGTNKEHMQNLAELLYALMYPNRWSDNLDPKYSPNPKMWYDFKPERYKLNNKWFFMCVAHAWAEGGSKTEERRSLFATLFGYSSAELEQKVGYTGPKLLYDGYSWWTSVSWKASLYEAAYSTGNGKEGNFHKAVYSTVKKDVENFKSSINIYEDYTQEHPYIQSEEFFGDLYPRYIVRHATGEDLCGKEPDVYTSIVSPTNGLEDYYRYNDYYNMGVGTQWDPEECTEEIYKQRTEAKPGEPSAKSPYYQTGDILLDETDESRWLCFRGSSQPLMDTEEEALFVSFDKITTNGNVATNIVKNDNNFVHDMFYFTQFYEDMTTSAAAVRPIICDSVQKYMNLDLRSLTTKRDSVYIIVDKNGKPVTGKNGEEILNSNSTSTFFNVAYDDGSTDKQPLLRVVYDLTRAGKYRTADELDEMMYWRFYKHYMKYDPNRPYTEEETAKLSWTGWSKWVLPWVIDNRKICLQDVADQQLVNEYNQDKWVVLPLYGQLERGKPRTAADGNAKTPSNYFLNNGTFATNSTGMYNEPVIFMRIMRLRDKGKPNETSPEGHKLKVLCHQTDNAFASSIYSHIWAVNSIINKEQSVYVDDKHETVK